MLNDSMFAVSGIYADGFIGYTVYDINLNKIERVILTTLNGGINSMYLDAKRRLHLAGYTLSSAKEFHPYVFVSKPVTYVSASEENAGTQENNLRVYPNPAEDEFNVEYEISRGGYHKLSLINNLGMESCVLSEGQALAGKYRAEFSITEKKLTSGIYFLRLLNDREIITEKVIILK
jgi:hypothetical protein